MGQQQTNLQPHSARSYHYQNPKQVKNQTKSAPTREHEGILKLRSTPFPNCVQISTDGLLLFLQNAQTTLFQLLENRLYTNRLFPLDDIQKLIENIIYTLAFLAEANIVYKDLCPENIYYCNGAFKLLPNQLIEQKFYDKAWQNFYGLQNNSQQEQGISFPYLSPQLIIALRMKEKQVNDIEILNKSNAFIFGLILLQSTTLLPSSQCFDPSNYDIFNNVISERLDLVEANYNQCIARIIANMIDYDFNQRMDLKQLSIWINRELAMERKSSDKTYDSGEQKRILNPVKSTLSMHKSRYEDNQQKQPIQCNPVVYAQQEPTMPQKNVARKNLVYINGYDESRGQDSNSFEPVKTGKNYVYLETLPQYEVQYQLQKKIEQKNVVNHIQSRAKLSSYTPNQLPDYKKKIADASLKYSYQRDERFTRQNIQQEPSIQNSEQYLINKYLKGQQKVDSHPYAYQGSYNPYLRQVDNIRPRVRQPQPQLRKNYELRQRQPQRQQLATSKLKNENKYYPSLSQIQNRQRPIQTTKRIPKHPEVNPIKMSQAKQTFDSKQSKQSDSKCSVNDGSINRIKLEIEKSRKLIEEFRKCEGIEE